ncbi:DUF4012 domain-containing protein [Dactylosporangium sp. CA-092794]|uniref:DUF4012 domain-containing protein n=1 Tax=Dactylosporangium sp. CA-092794 TaxID=3239929 RepID=UPI003D8BBEFC
MRAVQVRDDLQDAARLLQRFQQELVRGDPGAAAATLAAIQRLTRSAAGAAGDPAVRLAARLPGPGRDLRAARVVAVTVDDVARRVLPVLLRLAEQGNGLRGGSLDLGRVRSMAGPVAAAAGALEPIRRRIEAVPDDGLSPRVAAAVAELRGQLGRAAAALDAVRRATALVPAMLGDGGERTYLVLFQNPAEVRATGGMPGAYAVVAAGAGRLRLVAQGTASAGLRAFDAPVLPVDPQTRALYGDAVASHPANITMVPNFPAAAAVAREMYRLRSGVTVDGVLATDPVTLSYLLAATGPVAVPDGPALDASSAVRVLLADTYARFATQPQQDAYFARAARAAFEALTTRAVDGRALLSGLARAAGEHRVLLWSAHPEEQALIAGSAVEGALPERDAADRPTVGVFLNDGGGAKLDYYLAPSLELAAPGCRRELTATLTLGSTAPASGLPAGVLTYQGITDPYTARTFVSVYAPTGWGVLDAQLDGAPVSIASGTDRGRMVALTTLDVRPGQRRTLRVRLSAPDDGAGPWTPAVWTTPTVAPWSITTRSPDSCGRGR